MEPIGPRALHAEHAVADAAPAAQAELRQRVLQFLAAPHRVQIGRTQDFAAELAAACAAACGHHPPPAEVFAGPAHFRQLSDALLGRFVPDLLPVYFAQSEFVPPGSEELLAESQVEGFRRQDADAALDGLPQGIVANALGPHRPALRLYHFPKASFWVSADGHMLFDPAEGVWFSALSSHAVPRKSTALTPMLLNEPLVVIRDRYVHGNIAHEMFDHLPRILHLIGHRPDLARHAVFVMSQARRPIHALLEALLAKAHGLRPEQFLYVQTPAVYRSTAGVYGFSSHLPTLHPLNRIHPQTVATVRALLAQLPLPGGSARRVYISRADARIRRVQNEGDLLDALRQRGFRDVRLAELPLLAQIDLIAHAEAVVGPHGMGLAHVLHARSCAALVELFPPSSRCTFAYGAVARALDLPYRHVTGSDLGERDDFTLNIDAVAARLDDVGIN